VTTPAPSFTVHAARQPVEGSPEWCCLVTSPKNGHELTVFGDSAKDATKRAHMHAAAWLMYAVLQNAPDLYAYGVGAVSISEHTKANADRCVREARAILDQIKAAIAQAEGRNT
jgi:hypothetical protein